MGGKAGDGRSGEIVLTLNLEIYDSQGIFCRPLPHDTIIVIAILLYSITYTRAIVSNFSVIVPKTKKIT